MAVDPSCDAELTKTALAGSLKGGTALKDGAAGVERGKVAGGGI
jgi:hypothetical protein